MRSAEEAVRRRGQEIMRAAMPDVRVLTQEVTPIDTTELVNSIEVSEPVLIGNIVTCIMSADAPHAKFVRDGTRPHTISSTGPWPLRNRNTGQIFGRSVNHPGTRPHPEWWSDAVLQERFNAALNRYAG